MQPQTRQDWSDHLLATAAPVLLDTPFLNVQESLVSVPGFIDSFADEHGDRRAVDRPLLAHMLRADPGPTPDLKRTDADLRLWWALHDGSSIESVVTPGPGPVVGVPAFETGAIETTTETELGALHALAHHARRDGRWRARCLEAARWHVEMLQPDNGTNHPWAVHVFLDLAYTEADPAASAAARIHAETLMHNALVSTGRPDLFSACLLLDAARSLA